MSTMRPNTLEWIRQQQAFHRAALADLEATERILIVAAETSVPSVHSQPKDGVKAPRSYGAKKRAILMAIDASPQGLTTQGVIAACTSSGLEGLKTENTSPKLSAYKGEGLLELDNGLWRITPKGREFVALRKD